MATRSIRWFNQSLPQMLQTSVFLCYFDAVISVLDGSFNTTITTVLTVAFVAAGLGLANERRWGYSLALTLSLLRLYPFVEDFVRSKKVGGVIGLAIAVATFLLLVLRESREYQADNFAP